MTDSKKPKVLFVQPKLPPSFWGMEFAMPFAGYKYPNPPLGLLTLAGAISPDYEVEIRDENVGDVLHDTDADIVGISGTLLHEFHISRVREIANYFRKAGKLICIGGPVATLTPHSVRDYCDVIFEGEGEYTWPQFLADYLRREHKDIYVQTDKVDMAHAPLPRVDLVNAMDYSSAQIQTTRGCPFTCEFCDIIVMYGRKVRAKPVERVLEEVRLWADAGQLFVFFSDDNFVGNRVYAKALLKALTEFNAGRKHPVQFFTQASIDTAKDPALMELMSEANFVGVFIGIESPRKSSLTETLKVQNVHTSDLIEAIHTIQSYGLFVSGGMIIGFDNDDKDIFEEQFRFLQQAGIPFAQLSLLEAMPKTPLWTRMKESGRLLEYREGLCTNIKPIAMTYEELIAGYNRLIKRVYDYDNYVERYLTSLKRMNGYQFAQDRPRISLHGFVAFCKILFYFLFSSRPERRKFFIDMMSGTWRINARAWRWTFRYTCNFIHFHRFANENLMVVMAPAVESESAEYRTAALSVEDYPSQAEASDASLKPKAAFG
ncbi:MAG: radical SAM proteinB12-binding domain-containing radical SAM protein [Candidatus Melainabacteria bacterium]|nr:MAG: radical SAM proteinB12-binding domain-containing radical SAM protein [Candidatus Melainabacteria bacterium]